MAHRAKNILLPGPLQKKFGSPCIRNDFSPHLRGGVSQGQEYQEAGVVGSHFRSCLSYSACQQVESVNCSVMSDLCNPMDCNPPGSSVHGILQARILEWVAISASRGSSQPRDQTHASYVSCIGKQVFYNKHHLGSLPTVTDLISVCCVSNRVILPHLPIF